MPAKSKWDVAVIGCGAIGSAALYQLARRGVQAVGIDRFNPPHDRGSSHGQTRITRLALGEGEQYVQFARRSHEIWRELEDVTGRTLLQQAGGLIYGSAARHGETHGATDFLQTTINVARKHGIAHEIFDGRRLADRFPQFRWRGDEVGYFEPEAGFVHPETCIAAQLTMASRLGAEIRTGERLLNWQASRDHVQFWTDAGHYEVGQLILSTGAWLPSLAPSLSAHARVLRQVLFWFEPDGPPGLFSPERMPVYIRVPDAGSSMFYGFPSLDSEPRGLKVAAEQFESEVSPDDVPRDIGFQEIETMRSLVAPHLRITARCVHTTTCLYTVTPDFGFVIDQHPASQRAWLVSACSGHGFKHSAAVGEALAEIAVLGKTRFDLGPFRLARLAPSGGSGLRAGPD